MVAIGILLSRQRTIKVLIRLCRCTGSGFVETCADAQVC